MSTKPHLFQQLWTIFSTTIIKNPPNFGKHFSSLIHVLPCHAVSLWLHFYNKNYTYFNIDDKTQILKNVFFADVFLKNQNVTNAEFSWVAKYGLGSVTSKKFRFVTQRFS